MVKICSTQKSVYPAYLRFLGMDANPSIPIAQKFRHPLSLPCRPTRRERWSSPNDSPIQHIVGEGVNQCRPYVHFHLGMSIRRGMEPSVVEWGELLLRMLQLHGGYLVHHGPRDVATLLDVRTVARQPTQHGKLGQQLGQLVLHVTHDGLYVERLCRRLQVLYVRYFVYNLYMRKTLNQKKELLLHF